MWPNPQETADLVTFTEEILTGKLYFFSSVVIYIHGHNILKHCFVLKQIRFTLLENILYFIRIYYRVTKRLRKLGNIRKISKLGGDMPTIPSRNKTSVIVVKDYAKGDTHFCLIDLFRSK